MGGSSWVNFQFRVEAAFGGGRVVAVCGGIRVWWIILTVYYGGWVGAGWVSLVRELYFIVLTVL